MATAKRLGERRAQMRFDVAGQLWAELDVLEGGELRNLARGGALVEARLAGGLGLTRSAELALGGAVSGLQAIVRHLTPLNVAQGDDRYLVGLEFVNLTPEQQARLDDLLRAWNRPEPPAPAE
jgi:hypothetical protein